ncbi:MAG: hypothetical protein O9325_00180, partial [Roseomonas sp.]|nr:hypothetical protein [Roseomonas sp.]
YRRSLKMIVGMRIAGGSVPRAFSAPASLADLPRQPASAAPSAYRGRNIPYGPSAAGILKRSLTAEQVLAARIIRAAIFKARRGDKLFAGLVGEGRVMEA